MIFVTFRDNEWLYEKFVRNKSELYPALLFIYWRISSITEISYFKSLVRVVKKKIEKIKRDQNQAFVLGAANEYTNSW